MIQDRDIERKPQPEHSNFCALLYVWSITALILAGIGALVYWVFIK